MTDHMVRKRCDRCGHMDSVPVARRACYRQERNTKGFKTGYRCPGTMRTVVRRRKAKPMPLLDPQLGLGQVLTEDYQRRVIEQRGNEWRDGAAKHLERARQRHKEAAAKAKRAEKQMREWTVKIRALVRRTKMSDAEIEQVRQRAATAAQVSHVKRRLRQAAGVVDNGEKQQ